MKFLLLAMMLLQQGAPPVEVQKPVTRTVLVCPKDYILWVRMQKGLILVGNGIATPIYNWELFDGEGIFWSDMTPTCFKAGYDPNSKENAK